MIISSFLFPCTTHIYKRTAHTDTSAIELVRKKENTFNLHPHALGATTHIRWVQRKRAFIRYFSVSIASREKKNGKKNSNFCSGLWCGQ